jgi:hypothetical protein
LSIARPAAVLGGALLVLGVQGLELCGLLVVPQRLLVQLGGLPMEIAQHRIGRFGHQPLAALGRLALAEGPLARPLTELLGAPSPLAML